MQSLIMSCIHWENYHQYIKEKCTLSIESARVSKAAMSLTLTLRTNFFVREEDAAAVKNALMRQMPELSSVAVTFVYEDMQSAIKASGGGNGALIQSAEKAGAPVRKSPGGKASKSGKPGAGNHNILVMGKRIGDPSIPIDSARREMMTVVVEGLVFAKTLRGIKNAKTLVSLVISDYTESICVKVFIKDENLPDFEQAIREGVYIKVNGKIEYDNYENSLVVYAKDIEEIKKEKRMDTAAQKRIELHAHTKMSAMDGVADAALLVKTAQRWGHEAIAITDHAVVQAFPDASHAAKDIKVIYGMEGYLVDDGWAEKEERREPLGPADEYVVFDLETTGLSAITNEIIEIGAVRVKDRVITDTFHAMVKPKTGEIPRRITELTGITTEMTADAQGIKEVLPAFLAFAGKAPLVAHNADFDMGFLKAAAARQHIEVQNQAVDTLYLSRLILQNLKKHKLDVVAKHFGIDMGSHHRADDDARTAALILIQLINRLEQHGITDLNEAARFSGDAVDYKNKKTNHIILLAKNQTGLKNLYTLVTLSHMSYFYKKPRIPRSVLAAHREGLLIGGACQDGEIYQGILAGKSDAEVERICRFYDYLEVQPIGNNMFLADQGKVGGREALEQINRRIVQMARRMGKPVAATSDAHYIEPEEGIYRSILMAGQGYKDVEEGADLYLRTTDEMLSEFAYLDEETAHEVVIAGPKQIADQIDTLRPVPKEKYPPKMDNAEEELRRMCEERAKEVYGDPLPDIVRARLDRELNSIIGNGYAVMYIIAQRLVKKSLDDGYVVGSRGSVGSSFAATMSGITEVNPLQPHYVCPGCKHSEFQEEGGVYGCGVDMPEKNCPHCGTLYHRDGFEIPFEVFLGFEGDKEPDIDLNFAGEYQPTAHKYIEILFEEKNVFRAGTIGTVAAKTAFGFVMKYCEEREITKSKWEIDRLAKGCEGVKRTTGQHPGGIIILPKGNDIHEFTPVQHPANDSSSGIKTTHFDYHSIDQNLLKLDILGHDAPSIIRMLKDMTGIDPQTVSLSDEKVNSLFVNASALGIQTSGFRYSKGSLGVPEFGTSFVRQMLEDTKPATFSGLLRISGFSHGTDVWLNNAKDFILEGTAKLEEAISVRDDIMIYLIAHGMNKKHAFKIMENVRKGKGISDEDAQAMKDCNVPLWYAESCRRIKYMFPKAHAVAYVMMAYRIAYFKVYYPLAFYAAFFTSKNADFNAEVILGGITAIEKKMDEVSDKGKSATAKELGEVVVLELAYEMYCRGFDFMRAELGKSDAVKFQVADGKVLLPFAALTGVGENAAKALAQEHEKGLFMSVEELRTRTGLNKTAVESLKNFGVLAGIPDTNQLSFF